MFNLNVIWTFEAEKDLDEIYEFYLQVSDKIALKIISEIILETDKIVFLEEFQVDEINSNYRRIFVRHFKIVYRVVTNEIVIFGVFDSRQNPEKLRKMNK
ncbi:type II toxin-antitoxin system RelE/ParE family toxin [Flavobacterium sp.]|jgi:plasmid stabilization system protein ParE|uniref:type II toxin-antitoxin system RelE/ParE family toxin n=1 Tax=Flavobacterium sp. TaxID=239 RepID=UPI0037BED881